MEGVRDAMILKGNACLIVLLILKKMKIYLFVGKGIVFSLIIWY